MADSTQPVCGISADSEFFDHTFGVKALPRTGETVVLAAFQLPPQYCGILENFAQFTDVHAWANAEIDTSGLVWSIRRNGQPLYPYTGFEIIVNAWGFNNYPVAVRLDEGSRVELVLHNRSYPNGEPASRGRAEAAGKAEAGPPEKGGAGAGTGASHLVQRVAGRISGRYWFNRAYGGPGDRLRWTGHRHDA